MVIPSPRLLLAGICLCVAAKGAPAQQIAFPGIAWGTPAEDVRARLEAQGYGFKSVIDSGDLLFQRADSAWLRVEQRAGRVLGFTLIDPARGEQVDGRYLALADSLRAARGEPDEVDNEGQREQIWVAGLAELELWENRSSGPRQVELSWHGPGWHDEMANRFGQPAVPPGYTIVSTTQFLRIAIDTTLGGPRGTGERSRFRLEYRQPITPSVAGVPQDPIDAVEYEMDIDCAAGRTRLVARTTFLAGRRLDSHRPENQPWTVPQPDGHYARGRDAVCRARRGGG